MVRVRVSVRVRVRVSVRVRVRVRIKVRIKVRVRPCGINVTVNSAGFQVNTGVNIRPRPGRRSYRQERSREQAS